MKEKEERNRVFEFHMDYNINGNYVGAGPQYGNLTKIARILGAIQSTLKNYTEKTELKDDVWMRFFTFYVIKEQGAPVKVLRCTVRLPTKEASDILDELLVFKSLVNLSKELDNV